VRALTECLAAKFKTQQFRPRGAIAAKYRAPVWGAVLLSRSDDVTLPEPPCGFCLGFGLAEGQVVITWYRQLIPVLEATRSRDPSCDSDPTGPVQKAV